MGLLLPGGEWTRPTVQPQPEMPRLCVGGFAEDSGKARLCYHLFGVRAVAGAYSCLMYSLTIRLVQKRGATVLMLSLTI